MENVKETFIGKLKVIISAGSEVFDCGEFEPGEWGKLNLKPGDFVKGKLLDDKDRTVVLEKIKPCKHCLEIFEQP